MRHRPARPDERTNDEHRLAMNSLCLLVGKIVADNDDTPRLRECAERLYAAQSRAWGNRSPLFMPSWEDLRLYWAATLREILAILEEEGQQIPT